VAFRFNVMFCSAVGMKKVKKVATVFKPPQKLGILQHVEYEPSPWEWCTADYTRGF